jgi:hypothetical protein
MRQRDREPRGLRPFLLLAPPLPDTLLREAVVGGAWSVPWGAFVLAVLASLGLQRVGLRLEFLECLDVLADKTTIDALRKGFVLIWR